LNNLVFSIEHFGKAKDGLVWYGFDSSIPAGCAGSKSCHDAGTIATLMVETLSMHVMITLLCMMKALGSVNNESAQDITNVITWQKTTFN